ncbi:MAG: porphobilinogen synthase [Candidatus Omnitrophica bacterium]|nr:porphobilinogen synthase [Candidatus Omnitrophota bacterium]MCM8826970.1 porphobilinogen synthase [Candidatus Omnitrophota bacterium]
MEFVRLRRLRRNESIRELVSQTQISIKDLIAPYFVIEGRDKRERIRSMPGVFRLSIDNLLKDIKETKDLGIKAIILFGIPDKKDETASEAYSKDGIIQKAIKAIRKNFKDIVIITDVCLCGYTPHGHCGIIKGVDGLSFMVDGRQKKKSHKLSTVNYQPEIDNDQTLKILAKIALSHAEAGCDFVAPSAIMDGQVKAIREALDENGFGDTGILAYSAKYASNFYGPFREAVGSFPQFGDRKSYQMDYRNSSDALREIEEDIKEGADIVMVKPALAYLDIIYKAKHKFNVPIAAYNVSGEYSLVEIGASKGIVDKRQLIIEILTSIKRAGADLIITYHAKEVAKWLKLVDS